MLLCLCSTNALFFKQIVIILFLCVFSAVGDEERRVVARESEESIGMPMETLQTLPAEEDEFVSIPQLNGMAPIQGQEEEEEGEEVYVDEDEEDEDDDDDDEEGERDYGNDRLR